MSDDGAGHVEYVAHPFPPSAYGRTGTTRETHAAALADVACPDCAGVVQHNTADPTAWRVLHDETCPRWAEWERQEQVQQEARQREADRAERLARRRTRRQKPEGDSRG